MREEQENFQHSASYRLHVLLDLRLWSRCTQCGHVFKRQVREDTCSTCSRLSDGHTVQEQPVSVAR
jgi:hypothetical protein